MPPAPLVPFARAIPCRPHSGPARGYAQRPSLPRLSGLRYVNPAHQCSSIPATSQFLLNFVQESFFAIFANGIDVHLIHSRSSFIGLHPLPGFLQDVSSTDLIVEKREPPFRLLLGHSV